MKIDSATSSMSIMHQLQKMQQDFKTFEQRSAMAINNGSNVNINANNVNDNIPEVAKDDDNIKTTAGDAVGKFEDMLKDAFENVNILQNTSASMQSRFDVGDRSITLADVMLASQKSSISFEATMQVRNKMVEAYKTIMQMQI